MLLKILPGSTAVVACIWLGQFAAAEDWPTHMRDNQRTGVTAESLQPPFALAWEFESPFPPAEGWALPVSGYGARKNKPNVSHDDAFRVIAVGDTCYFSSSAENRIYAIDAARGTVHWSHFTDAAPRLAPAHWQGRIYVGADDGVFQCLDGESGKVIWRLNAAPHPDQMLGHGRFFSRWPIRSAGIVEDGTVYFTAGLFPAEHIYLYAVDARTGKVLWRRPLDDGGRIDHVPQGYLLAAGDTIWTTSRATPARWSQRDGTRLGFETPFPQVPKSHEYRFYNGGSYAQIWRDRHIVYGQACLLAYDPDAEFQDKWGRTKSGQLLFHWFNARQAVFHKDLAYFATDYHVLAVEQSRLADLAAGVCREFEEVYKRLGIATQLDVRDQYDALVKRLGAEHPRPKNLKNGPLRWGASQWQAWEEAKPSLFEKLGRQCEWMSPINATEAMILAGNVVYAGGEDRVVALDASTGRELWTFPTESRVRGLAVANGRFYVSCVDGTVRCFTPRSSPEQAVKYVDRNAVFRRRPLADPASETGMAAMRGVVSKILAPVAANPDGESTGGYCLIVGADNADLAVEIARLTNYRIELLAAEASHVPTRREELSLRNLHGGRVAVRYNASSQLPYPPYVFNLVVDQGALASNRPTLDIKELLRVTKPCGGVLITNRTEQVTANAPWLENVGAQLEPSDRAVRNGSEIASRFHFAPHLGPHPRYSLRGGGEETNDEVISEPFLTIRRGRIPRSRDWTHNYATAANTYCNEDPHVKGPFRLAWYGKPGPRQRIDRHATPPMPLVVGAVMFTVGPQRVMAHDIYNGAKYWEREIEGATRTGLPVGTSNLAADEASLFIAISDGKCLRLEAKTGKVIGEYQAPPSDDGTPAAWAWIATDGGLLYGSRAEFDMDRRRPLIQTSNALFAISMTTGRTTWTYEGKGIDHDGIAVAGDALFFADREMTAEERTRAADSMGKDHTEQDVQVADRHGRPIPRDLRKLVAIDTESGQTIWSQPLDMTDITLDDTVVMGRSGVACMVKDGVLVLHGVGSLGHPHREFLAGKFARRALYAFDAETGKLLWGGRKGYRKRPIIVGDYVYAEPFAWHLKTGVRRSVANPLSGKLQTLDFHRGYIGCSHLLASANTLFGAKSGIGYCNLDDQCGFTPFHGVDLACGLCAVPAGGVFVAPEGRSGCTCGAPIHTSLAMYPQRDAEAWSIGHAGGLAETRSLPVRHMSINLGAPGYRQDAEGNLWIPYPARIETGSIGDWLPTYQHDASMCFRYDDGDRLAGTNIPWVFTSGYAHDKPLRFRFNGEGQPAATYTIRLYFAEPEDLRPGDRVFSVMLQGKTVLDSFDISKAAGGPRRPVVKEFPGVLVRDWLELRLISSKQSPDKGPLLCGIQAFRK